MLILVHCFQYTAAQVNNIVSTDTKIAYPLYSLYRSNTKDEPDVILFGYTQHQHLLAWTSWG